MLDDASRFALRNRYIIDQAPLQIYISALLFAPSLSILRQMFGGSLQDCFSTMAHVPKQWGAEKQILKGHEGGVTEVVCSSDGKTIVSSGYDSSIRTWDAATGEQCKVFLGHDDIVSTVDISADGTNVASASDDETVRLWSVVGGKERVKLETTTVTQKKHDVDNDSPCVGAVAFSPDGSMLTTACYDTIARMRDAKTGKEQRMLEGHKKWIRSIAYLPNGDVVATSAEDGVIKLWNSSNGKEIRSLETNKTGVNVIKFSPDGNVLASGSADGCIRLWVAETGEMTHCLDEHSDRDHYCVVEDLAFSPNGKTLASVCNDQTVILWDVETGAEKLELQGHHDIVNSVAFLPDGKTIVSASDDETIRLWDLSAIGEYHQPNAHSCAVSMVAFSPDGKIVASAASMDDMGVRLWDTTSGAQALKIPIFEPNGNTITFSPDGKILTLLWDKQVRGKWAIVQNDDTGRLSASDILGKSHQGHQDAPIGNELDQHGTGSSERPYREHVCRSGPKVTVDLPWIKREGEDFILLPYEYRGVCWTTSGASVAIGQESGAVTILSLM